MANPEDLEWFTGNPVIFLIPRPETPDDEGEMAFYRQPNYSYRFVLAHPFNQLGAMLQAYLLQHRLVGRNPLGELVGLPIALLFSISPLPHPGDSSRIPIHLPGPLPRTSRRRPRTQGLIEFLRPPPHAR
jgi:hypothetical protein